MRQAWREAIKKLMGLNNIKLPEHLRVASEKLARCKQSVLKG